MSVNQVNPIWKTAITFSQVRAGGIAVIDMIDVFLSPRCKRVVLDESHRLGWESKTQITMGKSRQFGNQVNHRQSARLEGVESCSL